MRHYDDAGCVGADPALFDPVTKGEIAARMRIEKAFGYCRSCPLVIECHEDAVRSGDDGVRGGVLVIGGHIQRLPAPAEAVRSASTRRALRNTHGLAAPQAEAGDVRRVRAGP